MESDESLQWLFNSLGRPLIARLCRDWMSHNRLAYGLFGNRVEALIVAACLPVDLLFHDGFSAARPYMAIQLAISAFCIFNFLVFRRVVGPNMTDGTFSRRLIGSWLLLSGVCLLTASYAAIMAFAPEYVVRSASMSSVLITVFASLFLHRFWREQYFFNAFVAASAVAVWFHRPSTTEDVALILIADFMGFASMFIIRRDFFASLFERYCNLSMFLPPHVARHLTLAQSDGRVEQEFAPRERFVACMCCDWRDFQKLIQSVGPEGIVRLYEQFYILVFKALDAAVPSGNYIVEWTADELFVIFYDDLDRNDVVMKQALDCAHTLATDTFREARADCSGAIVYDIGVAAGVGLLGLIGPRRMKKVTVAGVVAGVAKRLETEAKGLRARQTDGNLYPIIIMGQELKAVADQVSGFGAHKFVPIEARSRNIEGLAVHAWQCDDVVPASAPIKLRA